MILVPILLVVGVIVARRFRRKRLWKRREVIHRKQSPALPRELIEWMARLDREWKKRHVPRPATRAPLEHVRDIPADKLPDEVRETSLRVIDCYYRAAFRGDAIPAEDLAELRENIKMLGSR
jgi:hypothetical protein